MYKALVLSGGGIRTFCQLGALQYLFDNNVINVDCLKNFYGTSAGSMICFFLSIGYNGLELMLYICSNRIVERLLESFNMSRFLEKNGTFSGIYDYSIINNACKDLTIDKIGYIPTLEELYSKHGINFTASTYNLTTKCKVYLHHLTHPELSILDALHMSSNVPYIFGEFFYNDKEYVDGGVADNFCIEKAMNDNIQKIAIVSTKEADEEDFSGSGIMKLIDKIYTLLKIPLMEMEEKKIQTAKESNNTLLIILKSNISPFSFDITMAQRAELFSFGYNHAKESVLKSPSYT